MNKLVRPNIQLPQGARLAVVLLIGIAVGSFGTIFFLNYNPKDEVGGRPNESITAVFGRIVEQSSMISAAQDYTFVEKATDAARLFDIIDIPFTENSFWYRYSGTVEAAVDLKDAQIETENETTLRISLPQPELSNKPDMDISGVLEEHNNLLNPIHVSDVDQLQRDCIERGNEQARKDGLLSEAKTNTQNNFQRLFDVAFGTGTYNIQIDWLNNTKTEDK